MGVASAHTYARERGVSRGLCRFARVVATVVLRLWVRLRVIGSERVPANGPAIITPNHKDPA